MNLEGLKWEAKEDGMYLTAFPESHFAGVAALEDEFIKDLIMNVDIPRVAQVMEAKSGRPEFVGPHFIRFDQDKLSHLEIICTKEYAKLTIFDSMKRVPKPLTVKDIEFILKTKKVVFGVDWSLIAKILANQLFEETHIIAAALEPIRGKDAVITELVEVDPDAKPLENSNGSVDFRRLENIQQIEEGGVICRRTPPTLGEPGMDIFGHSLAAKPGDDAILPRGKNTVISDDSLELRALSSGYLYREGPAISVGNLYVVSGHVNFKTGNIQYSGDVAIRGNVLTDFIVEADGDITIEGEVEGARIISKNGFVHIKKGVFGKGKAFISGAKGVRVHMAQGAQIQSEGIVEFDLNLLDSKVQAESLKASGNNTLINNCEITVYDTVKAKRIGTPAGATTIIEFLNRKEEEALDKFDQLNELYSTLKTSLTAIETRLKTMKAILKKATEVTQRSKEELKKVLVQYEGTKKKLALVEKKRQALTLATNDSSDLPANIIVEEIMPKLVVEMYGEEYEFRDSLKEVKVHWKDGSIQAVPLEKGDKA